MQLEVLSTSITEPVSHDDVKAFMGYPLADTSQNATIDSMIIAAREWLEKRTALSLISKSYRAYFEKCDQDDGWYELPVSPVLDVPAIKVVIRRAIKRLDTITLTGTQAGGTANIVCDGLTKVATFDTTLTKTASNFVTVNAVAYLAVGVVLTSYGEDLIFTANVAGVNFTGATTITNTVPTLSGIVVNTRANVTEINTSFSQEGLTRVRIRPDNVIGTVLVGASANPYYIEVTFQAGATNNIANQCLLSIVSSMFNHREDGINVNIARLPFDTISLINSISMNL